MNTKLITLLAAICGVLMLVILAEWGYAQYSRQQLLSEDLGKQANAALDEMPTANLTEQPEDSYQDLVTRPLFITGRRPVKETLSGVNLANAVAVKFDWVLIGVYTSDQQLHALLVRTALMPNVPSKQNYRRLLVGADLDGWKLTEIGTDKVIFNQEGMEKILPLRKAKPKAPPKVPEAGEEQPPPEGVVPDPNVLDPALEPIEEPINE
jgi:hypothetical protein